MAAGGHPGSACRFAGVAARYATLSDRCPDPYSDPLWHVDWGEPEPFNERTWRHRAFSDARKQQVFRYDSLGRRVVANRL